jgi:thiol-disulfide isomerase/thioredoxin
MKIPFIAAWLCAAPLTLIAAPFSDLSFEDASKQAAQTGKIVLVDFYTTWCGPCKLLDKNTWTDAAVIELLEQKTVALRIDAEKEADLSKRYKIAAYPSVLLIKPDGAEIDRLVGYREPKAFLEDFNAALGGKDSISRAKDKLTEAGTNNASARMELGNAMEQKGKDAEALTEYLWCFDHGLEADPSFSGVRLSFLLMNIKNLAAHYPPARQALETRRDQSQTKVADGSTDYQTVMDLISLNNTLDQKEKNFAIFDQLPVGSRGRQVMLTVLADQFLEAKRYEDVLQGTDGKAAFKEAVDRFSQMQNALGKDNPMRERMLDNFRQFTTRNGAQHFEALAGLKRTEDGKELAGQILKFDPSPATRTLLAAAAQRAGNDELAQFVKE